VEQETRTGLAETDTLGRLAGEYKLLLKSLLRLALYNQGVEFRRRGDLERALAALDEAIAIEVSELEGKKLHALMDKLRPHSNRARVHFLKQNYVNAFKDFDEEIRLHPEDHATYAERGLYRFFRGDYRLAITDLKKSLQADPASDKNYLYYMLWLYMAQSRAEKAAKPDLTAGAQKLASKGWPHPVVEFYLDNISRAELLNAAKTDSEHCEAAFYIGQWHLIRAQKVGAAVLLNEAKATCPKYFYEYTGAVTELHNLTQ
jgi:tetratricopeptide (TPR) repeat protein